jgi:hypothetical protein
VGYDDAESYRDLVSGLLDQAWLALKAETNQAKLSRADSGP